MLKLVHDTTATAVGDPETMTIGLDELCRVAAQDMLAVSLLAERRAYLEAHAQELDAMGKRLVVANGYARAREVTTGAGMVEVDTPRVDDRREGEHFSSAILPAYMRKSPKVTEVLPILYLRELSTGDFAPALGEFFGAEAGLSASSINRLTVAFQAKHERVVHPGPLGGRLRVLVGRRHPLQHPSRRGPPVLPGHCRRAVRRDKGAGGTGRRLPRVHRVVGRGAALAQGPGSLCPGAGRRRRGARVLGHAPRHASLRPASSAAGSTSLPTVSTPCPSACTATPRRPSPRSTRRRRAPPPSKRSRHTPTR